MRNVYNIQTCKTESQPALTKKNIKKKRKTIEQIFEEIARVVHPD